MQPDKALNDFAPKKNAIDVIYSAIEDNVQSADVAELMKKIQEVVDESIENVLAEPSPNTKIIDLSGLNFAMLEKYFFKATHKNAAVQSLKEKIEMQLKQMVDKNPLKVDFYKRYQEIITDYNNGKDEVVITETFRKLIEFVNSLTEEEIDAKREGLTDEQKAMFDILRKPDLTKTEKDKIKAIAIELLEELKKEKLQVELWADKSITAAAVFNAVSNRLFDSMPATYKLEDLELKTNIVYSHLKQQYFGDGNSIYGRY